VFIFFVATIIGCGGGGKNNNPIPPSPPNNGGGGNNIVSINVFPREVNSGNIVSLEVIIQNGNPINIEWAQSPNQPTGQFLQLDSRKWLWIAPNVSNTTTFTLTATVTFTTITRQVSTTITVLPPLQPPPPPNPIPPNPIPPPNPNLPPNPSVIQVIYPWEDGKVNVVGNNTILTINGNVYLRNVNKVEAYIDNEKVVETIPILFSNYNYYYFELNITKFGNMKGNKQVIIKAITTDNAIEEYKLNIIYDNNLLYSLAVEFLRKYSCIYHENEGEYRIVRFGNLNNGPYNKPIRVYVLQGLWSYKNYIEKACEFWTKYTGIQFQIILQNPTGEEPPPVIRIRDWFDKDPVDRSAEAATKVNNMQEITDGDIRLFAGWLRMNDYYKIMAIAHELGHVLLVSGIGLGGSHTNDRNLRSLRSLMDPRFVYIPMLHTYQQLAVKIIYTKNPGESI
jgi:hypothetical protein